MYTTVVITAFYNNKRYLREAVESVAKQTLIPLEHVLVDDASTDGSLALAEQLAQTYPNVRVVRHEVNQGYPAALNTGIATSKSDFVAIIDGDDIALPTWLQTTVPVIESYPDVGAVGGGGIIITERGLITGQCNFCNHEGDVTEMIQSGRYLILHPGTVIRRSSLEAIGGYNPHLKSIEDGDMYLCLTGISRLLHVGQPLIYYRRQRWSQSRRSPEFEKKANEFFAAKSDMLKRGLSVDEANTALEDRIESLRTVPRLLPPTLGAYHHEMALAFELGGRRWMAILRYLLSICYAFNLKVSMRGIIRCLLPKTIVAKLAITRSKLSNWGSN